MYLQLYVKYLDYLHCLSLKCEQSITVLYEPLFQKNNKFTIKGSLDARFALNMRLPLEMGSLTIMLSEKRRVAGKLGQFSIILYHIGIKEAEAMAVGFI